MESTEVIIESTESESVSVFSAVSFDSSIITNSLLIVLVFLAIVLVVRSRK